MAENNADELLENFWHHIDASLESLNSGGPIDMASLENKAKEICEVISLLDAKDAKSYKPKLEKLINYLASIQMKLEAQKIETLEEANDLNRIQMAQSAYRNSTYLAKKEEA